MMTNPTTITINGVFLNDAFRPNCYHCGVPEGQLHHDNCHSEICPLCEKFIEEGCECADMVAEEMEIEFPADPHDESALKEWEMVGAEVNKRRAARLRIPYVHKPVLCVRCGELWPISFSAEDWNEVIPPPYRKQVLCLECYATVRSLIVPTRAMEVSQD